MSVLLRPISVAHIPRAPLGGAILLGAFLLFAGPSALFAQGPPRTVYEAAGPRAPEELEDIEEAPDGITLGEAMARALEHSPLLASYSWEIRAADARIIQARLRRNPELSLFVEDLRLWDGPDSATETRTVSWGPLAYGVDLSENGGSGAGFSDAEVNLELTQPVRLGGKRRKALAEAARAKEVAQRDYAVARTELLSIVAAEFVRLYHAQQRYVLTEELMDLARDVLGVVTARVEAGKVSPIEESKAEIALANARIEHDRALNTYRSSRFQLAMLWHEPEPKFSVAQGLPGELMDLPDLTGLQAAIGRHPEVLRWAAEMERREAAAARERAERIPDLNVTVGLRGRASDSGHEWGRGLNTGPGGSYFESTTDSGRDIDTTVTLGVSVELPLFDRNQGNIAAAEAMARQAISERHHAEDHLAMVLNRAYDSLLRAHVEVAELEADALPKAELVFSRTEEGYLQGKFNFLEVLDAQRTLFELRNRRLDAREEFYLSLIDVEKMTGVPLRALAGDIPLEASEEDMAPGAESRQGGNDEEMDHHADQ